MTAKPPRISADFLEALLAQSEAALLVLDADGRVRFAGGPVDTLFGRCDPELAGRSLFDLVAIDDLNAIRTVLRNTAAGQPQFFARLHCRLLRSDATQIWTEWTLTNRLADATIAGITAHVREITDPNAPASHHSQSSRFLQSLTENLQDTIAIIDAAGRILDIFGSYARIGGWTREEIVGRSAFQYVHPEDRARVLGRLALHFVDLARGGRFAMETRFLMADGSYRWVDVTAANRLFDPHIRGLVISIRDITPRKITQAALDQSQARLATALTGAQVGIWDLDLTTGELHLDHSGGLISGLGSGPLQIRREDWERTVHRDDMPRTQTWIERCLSEPNVWHEVEYRHFSRRYHYRWVLLRGHCTDIDQSARPARLLGVVLDIHSRKAAEQRLAESQRSFKTALWGAQVAFWTNDLKTGRARMSPHFFEMTGIHPVEWRQDDKSVLERMHPDDRNQFLHQLTELKEGRAVSFELEYRCRVPNGWRWLLSRGRVVKRDAANQPWKLAGTTIDVSDRKRLEHALTEAVSSEQRRIGHDLHDGLGQELTGIALMLRGVTANLQNPAAAPAAALDEVITLVNRAIETTRDLAHGLSPTRSDHGGLVHALRSFARISSARFGVRVDFRCRVRPLLNLTEDAGNHLFRVAQEALTNALRHGHATRIWILLKVHAEQVVLRVTDNGRGMQERAAHASGMGLKIMAYRMQTLGGHVHVDKRRGVGTRITACCSQPGPQGGQAAERPRSSRAYRLPPRR